MSTKRRQTLTIIAKMRRSQQRRKGKHKLLSNSQEEGDSHGDNAPFVTFVEEVADVAGEEGEMSTMIDQPRRKLERVQFHLDNGRVDVSEVLDHLNTLGLQFESKPGIWHDLNSMWAGKSAKKFMHMQEVYVRKTGLGSWWSSKNSKSPWVDEWLVEGDTRKIYCARVSRLSCGNDGKVVGTAIRFENPYGLLLTAHHCCTFTDCRNGELHTRNDLYAFNTLVEVIHLSDKYDLAFLLLKSGPYVGGFRLATRAEEKRGREVRMLSFPWHVDRAFGFDHENIGPTEVHGHIANLGPEDRQLPIFVDALATYMGGFAASPGGAVTVNSKVLVGMHIRAVWHQKGETILPFKEQRKRTHQGRCQDSCGNEDFGKTSKHRESPEKKKRKMLDQHINCNEDGIQGISSHIERSKAKLTNKVGAQGPVQRHGAAKCTMYHGYLSTYLSASFIKEEYDEFVSYWREGGFSKKGAASEEVGWFQYFEEGNHPIIKRRR